MAKESSALSVRIDPDVQKEFTKYTKENSVFSQAKIVESLIQYFLHQNEEQKQLIVMGVARDYVDLLGEVLQLVTWGDHAWNGYKRVSGLDGRGSYLPWVIEIYSALSRISPRTRDYRKVDETEDDLGIPNLRRIAWFKLGVAWISMAWELRTQALLDLDAARGEGTLTEPNSKPNDWLVLYNAAIESVRVANAYYGQFRESLELEDPKKKPHPTIVYNQACTWSLIAQYLYERDAKNDELYPMAEVEKLREEENRKKANEQTPVITLGSADPAVEQALSKATERLDDVTLNYKENSEGMPFVDAQWLFDYAKVDGDLAFYRLARQRDYEKWLTKRKARISLYESYRDFRRELHRDTEEFLEKIEVK